MEVAMIPFPHQIYPTKWESALLQMYKSQGPYKEDIDPSDSVICTHKALPAEFYVHHGDVFKCPFILHKEISGMPCLKAYNQPS